MQKMSEQYDVLVAGAGLAGVCAAVAAARAGARTLVIEKEPFAGGISTAALETSICNYFHNTRHELIVGGCPHELIERMVRHGAVHKHWNRHRGHVVFDVEIGKLCMDEMLEDAGVDILFDTLIVDALVRDNAVCGVRAANRSGLFEVLARCTVDATGDADVAARSGVSLHIAPTEHSSLFRLGNVDVDAFADYFRDHPDQYITGMDINMTVEEALAFYDDTGILFCNHGCGRRMELIQEPIRRGEYTLEWNGVRGMDAFQLHAMRNNSTMIVNTGFFGLDEPEGQALSDLLRRGRKQAHYVAEFLRRTLPGCEHSFVIATPNASGLRRTRYLKTDFTLTREIYNTAPSYPDRIGRGVLIGSGKLHISDQTFDIPMKCVLPNTIDGIIIGSGRSASCVPAEMLRTMPVTMSVGQGAGTVAAVAANQGVPMCDVDLAVVQKELVRQGVNIEARA
jgi:hypothetical protein